MCVIFFDYLAQGLFATISQSLFAIKFCSHNRTIVNHSDPQFNNQLLIN